MHSRNLLVVGTAAFAAFLASSASATLYTLGGEANENNVGSSSSPVSWSDTSNWTPTGVPGSGDSIQWAPSKTGSHRHAYILLDGDYTIDTFSQSYRTLHLYKDPNAAAQTVSLTFSTQLGSTGYQQSHELNSGVKFVIPASATYDCSPSDHTWSGVTVKSGAEADIYGIIQSRVMKLDVNGGDLVFDPVSYAIYGWGRSDTDHDEINIASGTASFPNGIAMTGVYSVPNQVNQSGGSVSFGGNFTSDMSWVYTWSAGALNITDDATFGANVSLVIPASSSVTLDVAAGKTFSAPGLAADASATITKTGAGVFAITPATEAAVTLNAGSIGLAAPGTYDLSNVALGAGATASIKIVAMGARIDSLPSALSSATFEGDLSGVASGTVVFYSSDASILASVQSGLSASVPAEMALVANGDALSLEAVSAHAFTASGNVLDAGNWGGSLPSAGEDVSIEGAGVVATLSSGTLPAWNSIEVKNGATLRISTNATLPPIVLNKSATLEITNDAVATIANVADLAGIATSQQLPVLSIATNSTLNVPGGMKFSNVNILLSGTIAATSAGGIVFGYAEAGETAYIGLSSNGGTVSIEPGSGGYNTSPLEFCCPASGGTVNAVGSLVLRNTTFLPQYERGSIFNLTIAYQIGFNLGVNNPVDSPFEVVFDNTEWGVLGSLIIRGGATFRLANGGKYNNFESVGYWGRYGQIAENGRIVVGNGGEFRLNAMGDYGTHALEINPSSANHQAVVVEDGGTFETYRSSGNGNGVFAASNGVYQVYQPSIYDAHYSESSGTTTIYDTTNVPFAGLAAVSIAANSKLTFSTRNKVFWDAGQFGDADGERVVALADVPITGNNASIELDNANVNVFGVVVRSGSNTATGTASVVEPESGEGDTTLYFANGANWAGTVVAGNVAFTNLVDAAGGAAVTFNNLRIPEGELVVRPGDTLTIDGAVLRQGGDTGRLVVTEGQANLRAKSPEALANANVRTAQGRRLALKPSKTADENGYYDFTAVVPTGITVIVR